MRKHREQAEGHGMTSSDQLLRDGTVETAKEAEVQILMIIITCE